MRLADLPDAELDAAPRDDGRPWLTIAALATVVFLLLVARAPAAPFPDGRYAYGPPADGRAAQADCPCVVNGPCVCVGTCPCKASCAVNTSASLYATPAEIAARDALALSTGRLLTVYVGRPVPPGLEYGAIAYAVATADNGWAGPGRIVYVPRGGKLVVAGVHEDRPAVSTGPLRAPVLPPTHFAPLPLGAPAFHAPAGGCVGGQCFAPQQFGGFQPMPVMMGGGCANGRCGR